MASLEGAMTEDAQKVMEFLKEKFVKDGYPNHKVWKFTPPKPNSPVYQELRAHDYMAPMGNFGSPWGLTDAGASWILQRIPMSTEARDALAQIGATYEQKNYPNHRVWWFERPIGQEKVYSELRARGFICATGTGAVRWHLTDHGRAQLMRG